VASLSEKPLVRVRLLLALLVAVGIVVTNPRPAQACSCGPPPPLAEVIEDSDWVFTGRQVGTGGWFWRSDILEIEVETAYKGDVPSIVDVPAGHNSSCGIGDLGDRLLGFTVSPGADGGVHVDECSGVLQAAELASYFQQATVGRGTGPPGFLTGVEIGTARIAMLDTDGELLGYGAGDGSLQAVAVCPGGEKIVELVRPNREDDFSKIAAVAVRDTASFAVESSVEIPVFDEPSGGINGRPALLNLECHDPAAELVTFLRPVGIGNADSGVETVGEAALYAVRPDGWDVGRAGSARAVAIDATNNRVYAITGVDGRTLETRDLTGASLVSVALDGRHVGWDLALSNDNAVLAVLARQQPMNRDNWYYAEVDSVLLIDVDSGRSVTHPLPHAGFAHMIQTTDAGWLATIGTDEATAIETVAIGIERDALAAMEMSVLSRPAYGYALPVGTPLPAFPEIDRVQITGRVVPVAPWWLWWASGLALLAAVGGVVAWRRRRADQYLAAL
jgi:hypothetical protein